MALMELARNEFAHIRANVDRDDSRITIYMKLNSHDEPYTHVIHPIPEILNNMGMEQVRECLKLAAIAYCDGIQYTIARINRAIHESEDRQAAQIKEQLHDLY